MGITELLIYIGIAAIVLTAIVKYGFKKSDNLILSYLQNFCGALFLFSGWVKAVDPLGTAYKLEEYFDEFTVIFESTWFSFITPIFPFFNEHAITFSVFAIVLEMAIGLMLIIGAKPKFTSWVFLGLIVFFTFLTGFTYLTGYVPGDVNFFSFGDWGPYVKSNMKVTDCGCFGDFIKLDPKISFFKDLLFLFPAIIFVFKYKDCHQLFTNTTRNVMTGLFVIGLVWYCLSNFVWDIPDVDFRPFRNEVNIRDQRVAEIESAQNVEMFFEYQNNESKEVVNLSQNEYMANYKNYPADKWTLLQTIQGEPKIKGTKLSEFIINDKDGNDISEDLLNRSDYHFMIVSYIMPFTTEFETVSIQDTTHRFDTLVQSEGKALDTIIKKVIVSVDKKSIKIPTYSWKASYQADFADRLNPLLAECEKNGIGAYALVGGAPEVIMEEFRHETQAAYPFYGADDILLKTIVRSNPGLVLMHDGKVIKKWHKSKMPSLAEVKALTK